MNDPLSVYVHIPFCRHKCPYCDFFVLANTPEKDHKQYVDYILKEIELFKHLRLNKNQELQSIYFGGGTPSLVDPKLIESILTRLHNTFQHQVTKPEISLEANPEDITLEKSSAWKKIGINRVTLGIQSLIDEELIFLGRQHQQSSALEAIETLNTAGHNNIGIDLMYQLPKQNTELFQKNLDLLFTQNFTHLSMYGLTIEPKTPFAKQVNAKQWLPLAEETSEQLFFFAHDYLSKKSFQQYEISNFSLPGFESKHNQCYWQQNSYWGLGASAHSYLPSHGPSSALRWWNPKNLKQYYECIDQELYPFEYESLSKEQELMEYVYTHLRTDGLDYNDLHSFSNKTKNNAQWEELIHNLKFKKLAQEHKQKLNLTLTGQMCSDWICQEVINALI